MGNFPAGKPRVKNEYAMLHDLPAKPIISGMQKETQDLIENFFSKEDC